jgi:hypothetical protein
MAEQSVTSEMGEGPGTSAALPSPPASPPRRVAVLPFTGAPGAPGPGGPPAPRPWWPPRELWRLGGELYEYVRLRGMIRLGSLVVVLALALLLFPRWVNNLLGGTSDRHSTDGPLDAHFATVILLACLLPSFLSRVSYLLINKRAVARSIYLYFPSFIDARVVEKAMSSWQYERSRTAWSLTRAESFASLWGFTTTLALATSVMFLIPPFHAAGEPFVGAQNMVAFAAIGAAATSFLVDFARICLRTANDDTSRRTFADSIRGLLLSLLATLGFMMLAKLLGLDGNMASPPANELVTGKGSIASVSRVLFCLGMGAGISIVGAPVFELLRGRVGRSLGLAEPARPKMTPLLSVPGMSTTEAERLAEEGIDSVEALVNTPVPRIFLNTRFSLRRVVDWIDKGLLLMRLGETAASDLWTRFGVAGILDIKSSLASCDKARAPLVHALKESMRLASDEQADALLCRMISDERLVLAEAFNATLATFDPPAGCDGGTAPLTAAAP